MTSFDSVIALVTLDDRDATTLRSIAWLAKAFPIKLLTIALVPRVWENPPYWPQAPEGVSLSVDEESLQADLDRLMVQTRAMLPVETKVESVIRQGAIVAQLSKLAKERDADLVCLTRTLTPHYDHVNDVAAAIVRKVPCSVFSIWGGDSSFSRLLVPVDFSQVSGEALICALRLHRAQLTDSLTVQHVYSFPISNYKAGRTPEELSADMHARAQEHWTKWKQELGGVPDDLPIRFDLSDDVPSAILQAADELNAGLVVLGGHGLTLPSAVLLGHVADAVTRRSSRSVLCIKKKGEVVRFLRALLQLFEGKE